MAAKVEPGAEPGLEIQVDAVLAASASLLGVAVRSLAAAGLDVTLAQARTLVLLATRGPVRIAELAVALSVNSSTATRMCDRLAAKRLVVRSRSADDRRVVIVELTAPARSVVERIAAARRREIRRILTGMDAADRAVLAAALTSFATAADAVDAAYAAGAGAVAGAPAGSWLV
ncbi:MAG: MarR family transcriptional regulator [Frankiaceae bacterium]